MPSNVPYAECQMKHSPERLPAYCMQSTHAAARLWNASGATSPGENHAAFVSLGESFLLGAIWKEYLGVCVS